MRWIILSLVACLLNPYCDAQTITRIDWNTDIDYLATELPLKHYDFFTVKSKNEFLSSLEKLKSDQKNLSDFEIAIRLQQLISGFGDSHTRVNYTQFMDNSKLLPLHLYWFSDGLFVLHTTEENNELLGNQLLALNGIPIQTVIDSLSSLITVDNEAMLKVAIPEIVPFIQLHEYFGFIKNEEIVLTVKDSQGNTKSQSIKPGELNRQNRKMLKPDSMALCYRNERALFNHYYLTADKTLYLQYNKCWSRELELKYGNAQVAEKLPSFKEYEDGVFQTLKTQPVNKIVFDLRFNQGGNSAQGTDFITKLSAFLKKNPNVNMYVIIGRQTFSSAILNAMDFKRLTRAIFVGEETAGKPNHFGEVKNFKLPGSGMRVNYSTKYFKTTSKKINTMLPDTKLETSFSDFSRGYDPAYEWIKRQ